MHFELLKSYMAAHYIRFCQLLYKHLCLKWLRNRMLEAPSFLPDAVSAVKCWHITLWLVIVPCLYLYRWWKAVVSTFRTLGSEQYSLVCCSFREYVMTLVFDLSSNIHIIISLSLSLSLAFNSSLPHTNTHTHTHTHTFK